MVRAESTSVLTTAAAFSLGFSCVLQKDSTLLIIQSIYQVVFWLQPICSLLNSQLYYILLRSIILSSLKSGYPQYVQEGFFIVVFVFFAFFWQPIYCRRPSFLSLPVVTQIRAHIIAGSSPALPTTVRALDFHCEKTPALSSLVDSRRIAPTHARRSKQLIPLKKKKKDSKAHHGGGTRTPGPTLAAFESKH